MENLLYYFRDLLMIQMIPNVTQLTDRVLHPEEYKEMAASFTRQQLFHMIDTLNRYQSEMKYSSQPQTLFEVALLKLCGIPQGSAAEFDQPQARQTSAAPADSSEVNQLKRQVAALEKKLEKLIQGGSVPSGAASGALRVRPSLLRGCRPRPKSRPIWISSWPARAARNLWKCSGNGDRSSRASRTRR
ncbi:DNA polymerase III subunits gamma and tau [Paenibacillus sp. P1XP2]|nr:DNA polymerase III subunits gamma and tau [Paenibacillus sp. P1XP2]